jgi:hypothetical protein
LKINTARVATHGVLRAVPMSCIDTTRLFGSWVTGFSIMVWSRMFDWRTHRTSGRPMSAPVRDGHLAERRRCCAERCAPYPNVSVVEGTLPDDLPSDTFDLTVFSEIGYYFERDVLARIRDEMIQCLAQRGVLIAAHWLGTSADHLLTGDEVHEILRGIDSLTMTTSHRHEGFLLESWERL